MHWEYLISDRSQSIALQTRSNYLMSIDEKNVHAHASGLLPIGLINAIIVVAVVFVVSVSLMGFVYVYTPLNTLPPASGAVCHFCSQEKKSIFLRRARSCAALVQMWHRCSVMYAWSDAALTEDARLVEVEGDDRDLVPSPILVDC